MGLDPNYKETFHVDELPKPIHEQKVEWLEFLAAFSSLVIAIGVAKGLGHWLYGVPSFLICAYFAQKHTKVFLGVIFGATAIYVGVMEYLLK